MSEIISDILIATGIVLISDGLTGWIDKLYAAGHRANLLPPPPVDASSMDEIEESE